MVRDPEFICTGPDRERHRIEPDLDRREREQRDGVEDRHGIVRRVRDVEPGSGRVEHDRVDLRTLEELEADGFMDARAGRLRRSWQGEPRQ